MEAPDKIFLERILCSNEVYDTWKSQKTISDDIEYIRTDVFIEKGVEWLNAHTTNNEKGFIGDFIKYMEDEL